VGLRDALEKLRQGACAPRLGWWIFGVLLCGLLDELLVAFGVLYLHESYRASLFEQTAAFAGFSLGSAVGLVLTERLLSLLSARRLLGASSLGCAIVYFAWLGTSSLHVSMALLVLTGLFTAPLFPIAAAQAYRAAPGHSTRVAALMQLTAPLELFLPLVIGWVADRFGLLDALWLLALQPLGMLFVLWMTRERP
jgi:fucose permease